MTSVKHYLARAVLGVFFMTAISIVHAADSAGKLLFVVRGVQIQHVNGTFSPGMKGDEFAVGEAIITGDEGRAQLLMADGTRIALKPNSEFLIESYQPPTSRQIDGDANLVVANETSGAGVLNLIKGGMRAVSGSITKSNPDGLTVKTPVATMGIRGTDWSAVLVGSPLRLLVGVREGQVRISNGLGFITVNSGEYGSAVENQHPNLILEQPDQLAGKDENASEGEQTQPDKKSEDGDNKGPTSGAAPTESDAGTGDSSGAAVSSEENSGTTEGQTESSQEEATPADKHHAPVSGVESPPSAPPPPPPTSTPNTNDSPESTEGNVLDDPEDLPTTVSTIAAIGIKDDQGVFGLGLAENAPSEVTTGSNNELLRFSSVFAEPALQLDGPRSELSIIGIDNQPTAQIFNVGADPETGFVWGRWANGSATVTPPPEGENGSIDLQGQNSLHWFYGPETDGQPLADITASASYSLVGNTEPVDSQGNIGVLGTADLQANFSTGAVDVLIQLGINNENWSASGSGQIQSGTHLPFSGSNLSGSVVSGQTEIGTITGQFIGAFSPNVVQSNNLPVPAGAAFSYGLTGSFIETENSVAGVAIVGNPQAGGLQ